jgi:HD-GYP domain-containing protein (c-di-GMP phosphodiesterase class II)
VDGDLRLADVLAALSVATDLGMGHEPEKAVRACLLATELARAADLRDIDVRDVYYTTLLQHLGCTAPAHELAQLAGDEHRFLATAEGTDDSTLRGSLELLGLVGRGTGARRPVHLARMLAAGKGGAAAIMRSTCEVGSRMAERLRLGDNVSRSLNESTEVWNGEGGAHGHAGDEIPLPARFALLATQVVLFDRVGGPDAATAMVRDRAGRWFDPDVVAVYDRVGPDLLRRFADVDVWDEVLDAEPTPHRCVPATRLDEVARVFGDMVDLKTPFTLGHSAGVADLAAAAAASLGLGPEQVTTVRRAALLHDLGRVAVPSGVWELPRALTTSQWEQVRLHPYHTERILDRSGELAPLARVAGMHHERLDGSGYHHRVGGAAIPLEARLLAAADVFQAMTQDRPHRPRRPPDQAAAQLETDAGDGGLDVECIRAVVAAAGQSAPPRSLAWPAGLTDREVDVLRLVARGRSNREIADELVISRRTAEHHVQNIYGKIGGSTRATAALFAMEHGLVR